MKTKRDKILLALFFIVIVSTFILLLNYLFSSFSFLAPKPSFNLDSSLDASGEAGNLNELNLKTLEDPRLDSLREHGQFPIEVGETGKKNPFQP